MNVGKGASSDKPAFEETARIDFVEIPDPQEWNTNGWPLWRTTELA